MKQTNKGCRLYITAEYQQWLAEETFKSQAQIAERLSKVEIEGYFGDHKLEAIKMAKTKTSPKQKKYSKNTKIAIKKTVKLIVYSPTQELLDETFIGKAILECLKNNGADGVMEIISIYLETLNRVGSAKKIPSNNAALFANLKKRNPTIKTLAKLVHSSSSIAKR